MGGECQPPRPCATLDAIRSLGEVRVQVDYLVSLLEAAIDLGEEAGDACGGLNATGRRAANLALVALDLAGALEPVLARIEQGLGIEVRERRLRLSCACVMAGDDPPESLAA